VEERLVNAQLAIVTDHQMAEVSQPGIGSLSGPPASIATPIPLPHETFIHYTSPVSPAHKEQTYV
jgi:hypothetical protein